MKLLSSCEEQELSEAPDLSILNLEALKSPMSVHGRWIEELNFLSSCKKERWKGRL